MSAKTNIPAEQKASLPTESGYDVNSQPGGEPAHAHEQGHVGERHVVSTGTYYIVFAALMVLLIITLVAAAFNLGPFNVIVAMAIAVVKAVLVILYFMHVRYSSKLTWVFAGAAFVFVFIMFGMTFSDYDTRAWLPQPGH